MINTLIKNKVAYKHLNSNKLFNDIIIFLLQFEHLNGGCNKNLFS